MMMSQKVLVAALAALVVVVAGMAAAAAAAAEVPPPQFNGLRFFHGKWLFEAADGEKIARHEANISRAERKPGQAQEQELEEEQPQQQKESAEVVAVDSLVGFFDCGQDQYRLEIFFDDDKYQTGVYHVEGLFDLPFVLQNHPTAKPVLVDEAGRWIVASPTALIIPSPSPFDKCYDDFGDAKKEEEDEDEDDEEGEKKVKTPRTRGQYVLGSKLVQPPRERSFLERYGSYMVIAFLFFGSRLLKSRLEPPAMDRRRMQEMQQQVQQRKRQAEDEGEEEAKRIAADGDQPAEQEDASKAGDGDDTSRTKKDE